MKNIIPIRFFTLLTAAAFVSSASLSPAAEKAPIKQEKLQIVFLFGQSNMVGLADVRTAWYLTQPQYAPPRELVVKKSPNFDWGNFYWSGMRYYKGPEANKQKLAALRTERTLSRMKWRQRVRGVHGPWNEAEWGPKPKGGRANMYPFLDKKAEEEGIDKRIAEILDGNENQLPVNAAYDEMMARDKEIAAELKRVREIYLKGATAEDFDALDAAIKSAADSNELVVQVPRGTAFPEPEKNRTLFANLAQKHVNLPIAKRTWIYGHGHIAGSEGTANQITTHGPLSVGYGAGITKIGPEYGIGITLERRTDAPILLVKCSWGNTSIASDWRAPSLDGVETATEKAGREAHNKSEAEKAKKAGRAFTPRPAPKKSGKLGYAMGMAMQQVDKILANPGKYHPGYDPKVGYEVAGMVWFQGYSDKDNPAYGELLTQLIRDFRKKVKTPDLPVVCGSLGMAGFKHAAFIENANKGMLQAAKMPDLAGKVDVVNTAPFYPLELDLTQQVREQTEKDSPENKVANAAVRGKSNGGFHYNGSAKSFLLMGDAMGRSLANLMAGGNPTLPSEPSR
jgi:hypothetical protein